MYFLDTLIQNFFLLIMKMYNFWGELTDISAKKEALGLSRASTIVREGDSREMRAPQSRVFADGT